MIFAGYAIAIIGGLGVAAWVFQHGRNKGYFEGWNIGYQYGQEAWQQETAWTEHDDIELQEVLDREVQEVLTAYDLARADALSEIDRGDNPTGTRFDPHPNAWAYNHGQAEGWVWDEQLQTHVRVEPQRNP